MKKINLFVLMLAVVMLFSSTSEAWAAVNRLATPPAGWKVETPQENTFQIAGHDESFILLDSGEDPDSTYFVMTKEAYGARAFDPDKTTKFDIEDSNNIAYWLNHEFITNGNGGMQLPPAIIEYIHQEHVWQTEGCRSNSLCPNDYETTAGIALLSQAEYTTYAPMFGVRDGIGSSGEGWWLRTARGLSAANPNLMLRIRTDQAALGQTHEVLASYASTYVKPVFYLKEDFLSKVKLNVGTMGNNVKRVFLDRYTPEQLQGQGTAQYNDDELKKIGYILPDSIILSDFEADLDGWASEGLFMRDSGLVYQGSHAARLVVESIAGDQERRMDKMLSVPIDMMELKVQLSSRELNGVIIELTDTLGQMESYPVELDSGSELWTEVTVVKGASLGAIAKLALIVPDGDILDGYEKAVIYVDEVKAVLSTSMTGNGGFEHGLWIDRGGSLSLESSAPHSGTYATRLHGGSEPAYLSTVVKIDPQSPAELTGWIKSDQLSAANAGVIEILELDSKGNPLGVSKRINVTESESGDWNLSVVSLGSLDNRSHYLKWTLRLEAGMTGSLDVDDLAIVSYTEAADIKFEKLGFIFDPSEVKLDLAFRHNALSEKTYTIIPVVTTDTQTYEPIGVTVQSNEEKTAAVPLQGLKNGLHKLRVDIKEGQRTVKTLEQNFSVMPTYQAQFGDEASISSVSVHFAQDNKTGLDEAELMARAGFRTVRDELQWSKVEKVPGVLDYERHDGWVNEVSSQGIQIIGTLNGNVAFYSGLSGVTNAYKYGPKSMVELDAFANYAYETAKRYKGKVDTFEIWNEPNLTGFWMPGPNVSDYVQLLKKTSIAIRKGNPDAVIIAGSVANQNGYKFLTDMLERDAYPYIDAISFHPYSWPSDPDLNYGDKLQNYADTLKGFGRWKDLYVTEVNWHTADDIRGVSEELQAQYLIKHNAISAAKGLKVSSIYDWRNDGTNPKSNEHNYGITHYDYSAKSALIALNQFNRQLAAAQFIGELHLRDGLKTYAYLLEGEPVLLMWSNAGDQVFDFGQESIVASDINGNPADVQSQVTVGANPIYVEGLSEHWLLKAVSSRLMKDYETWLASAESELGEGALTDIRVVIAELKAFAASLEYLPAIPEADVVKSKLTTHYEQGMKLIQRMVQGQLNKIEVMSALYDYYRASEGWERLLAVSVNSHAMPEVLDSDSELTHTLNVIHERAPQGGMLPFAEELLRHAKQRNKLAAQYKEGGRVGPAVAWDLASTQLAQWSREMAAWESVDRTDLFIHASPSTLDIYEGDRTELKVTVSSETVPVSGYVRVVDDNNNLLAEPQTLSLAGGERKELTLQLNHIDHLQVGSYTFNIELEDHDQVLQSQWLSVQINSKIDLGLLPADSTLSELEMVDVRISNLVASSVTRAVYLEAPDGWQLGLDSQIVELEAGEEKVLSFPVERAGRKAFNEYIFRASVRELNGDELISRELPLSFTLTVKANQQVSLDASTSLMSDLSAWSNAYPVYLNPPTDPSSEESWQGSNAAAKVYTLWDEEAYYVMVKAYDDYLNNSMQGAAIWNGDSVQLAFDTKNLKTSTYHADMYEYAFALTGSGEETFAYSAAAGKPSGERPGSWSSIKRDEEQKQTQYIIRIPKSEVHPMALQSGYQYGFNVALNDGDMLDRERYYEFTKGLASTKNPSFYGTWKLHDTEAWTIEDVNGDQQVDISDLIHIANKSGSQRGSSLYDMLLDVNDDGRIDRYDWSLVNEHIRSRIQSGESESDMTYPRTVSDSVYGAYDRYIMSFEGNPSSVSQSVYSADVFVSSKDSIVETIELNGEDRVELTVGVTESGSLHGSKLQVTYDPAMVELVYAKPAIINSNQNEVLSDTATVWKWNEDERLYQSLVPKGGGDWIYHQTLVGQQPGIVGDVSLVTFTFRVLDSDVSKTDITVSEYVGYGFETEGNLKLAPYNQIWVQGNAYPVGIQSLILTGPTSMIVGQMAAPLHVVGTYEDGRMADLTSIASYSSSNPSVATVSDNGQVQPIQAGSTVIQAVYGGVQSEPLALTVLPEEADKGDDDEHSDIDSDQVIGSGGVTAPGANTPGQSSEIRGYVGLSDDIPVKDLSPALTTKVEEQLGHTKASVVWDNQAIIQLLGESAADMYHFEVPVQVPDSVTAIEVPIPSDIVAALMSGGKAATVVITTPIANYMLPLHALKLDPNQSITVTITKLDALSSKVEQATRNTNLNGMKLLKEPIEFRILVADPSGQTTEVHDFDGHYISRSVIVQEADPDHQFGAMITEAGQLIPVPTFFERRSDGMYEVIMKRSGNSTYALFEGYKSFADIDGHWAQGSINKLAGRLITNGIEEHLFAPQQVITRAEMTALLLRAMGFTNSKHEAIFTDVHDNDWFAPYVATAAKLGLVEGDQSLFRPGDSITREELAVLITRAMKLAGHEQTEENTLVQHHPDLQMVSVWAEAAIQNCLNAGIILGDEGGYIQPYQNSTRAEAITMVSRMMHVLKFMN
jgi:hypothetical protein